MLLQEVNTEFCHEWWEVVGGAARRVSLPPGSICHHHSVGLGSPCCCWMLAPAVCSHEAPTFKSRWRVSEIVPSISASLCCCNHVVYVARYYERVPSHSFMIALNRCLIRRVVFLLNFFFFFFGWLGVYIIYLGRLTVWRRFGGCQMMLPEAG